MEPSFAQSRFSTHFNRLTFLGMWTPDILSGTTYRKYYRPWRIFCYCFLFLSMTLQMMDLYSVFGNLRRVTYNCCTSVIVIGITIKITMLYNKRDYLEELRFKLWKDSVKLKTEEEIACHDAAYSQLLYIQKTFYVSAWVFLPIWIISAYFSYNWGPRQLAFAAYLPMSDPMNDLIYVPTLGFQALCGFYVIFLVMEAELAMFSLELQLEAYYQILMINILKLNDIYGDESEGGASVWGKKAGAEVNGYLQKGLARKCLKSVIIRQMEILDYSKNFEYIFSNCMLLQMFVSSFLIVMNGLELSLSLYELNVKLYFQSGYLILILVDTYFICNHFTKLSQESTNVGTAAYSTVWYKMDADTRRCLHMIMTRSQKPPRITAGKLFLMDLRTFVHMLRNIYSWLMLFRQLGVK